MRESVHLTLAQQRVMDRAVEVTFKISAPQRFFLSQDQSCHWYLVPAEHREEWNAWCDIPESDERSWEVPDFAKALGGSPELITFTDPKDA